MKRTTSTKTSICSLALALVGLVSASAATINLIENGEFEDPYIPIPGAFGVSNEDISGWDGSSGSAEIWTQGFSGAPTLGSDGNPTGQHAEAELALGDTIMQSLMTPSPMVSLFFDAWPRSSDGINLQGINVQLIGSLSNTVLNFNLDLADHNAWTAYDSGILNVIPGETLTVRFASYGGSVLGGGAHVDRVRLLAQVPEVPETGGTFFPLLGVLGLLAVWRRHSRQAVG